MKQEDILSRYYSFCLKGDLPQAIKPFKQKRRLPDAKQRKFQARVQKRFIDRIERPRIREADPFVRDLVTVYRNYYRDALLNLKKIKKIDAQLLKSLNEICISHGLIKKQMDFGETEKCLGKALKKQGLFSLFGSIRPLRSLLIWRSQHQKIFHIRLVEGQLRLKVVFLDDFMELGWMHYATFGKHHVGGWAKKDGLYCVSQAYNIESERFYVSYLCHEAQHYLDMRRFPKLLPQDLEYRAKLAELVASKRPKQRLYHFKAEAKNTRSFPHSYAAFCINEKFEALGSECSPAQIRQKAEALLRSHSKELNEARQKKMLKF